MSAWNIFDDPGTDDKVETGADFINSHIKKKRSIFGSDKKARAEALENYEIMIEGVKKYCSHHINSEIFHVGAEFVQNLCESYEQFYNSFKSCIRNTASEIALIERKYVNGEGKATRYVCANSTCLRKMSGDMSFIGGEESANGELSAGIYQCMKQYTMMNPKPKNDCYFQEVYTNTIMPFWKHLVMRNYSSIIDMDILTALEKEAEYISGAALLPAEVEAYIKDVMDSAERLAAPFIEEPMAEVRHPFDACAYHPMVLGDEPDSPRTSLVHKLLDEKGGSADKEVEPNMLLFYHALYGLCANDLKRFQAPSQHEEQGGEYYAAYFNLIRQLGPNPSTNTALTPHLDRVWHLTKYLPDLDSGNQMRQEKEINLAMIWGLISGEIRQNEKKNEDWGSTIVYRPKNKNAEEFIVPNGTLCDDLYEVHDALSINLPQVDRLVRNLRENIQEERLHRISFEESQLVRKMNWKDAKKAVGMEEPESDRIQKFKIKQFAPDQRASVFDLIYWLKYSRPVDEFVEEDIQTMVNSIMEMIEEYVSNFIPQTEVYHRCYKIIVDQFELFVENLKDTRITRPANRIEDKIVEDIVEILEDRFKKIYKLSSRQCELLENMLDNLRKKEGA